MKTEFHETASGYDQCLIQVGINQNIVGKPDKKVAKLSGKGWQNAALSIDEFIESVRKGYAFSAWYKDGHRKGSNFIAAGFAAVDIDHGKTVDEACADPFVQENAAFLYTTPSHTDENHRFRIVFFFTEPLRSGAEWSDCLMGLSAKLGGDRAATDAARMFYGNRKAEVVRFDRMLSADQVKLLIAEGRELKSLSQSSGGTGAVVANGMMKLTGNDVVRLIDGSSKKIYELENGTSLHCPHHHDKKPSAFVTTSKKGAKGIRCNTCQTTLWCDDGSGDVPPYKAGWFGQFVEQMQQQRGQGDREEVVVTTYDQKFLPQISYRQGITFVKSPKGTGKTEALKAMVAQIVNSEGVAVGDRGDSDGLVREGCQDADGPHSVLVISHRRSLASEAARRFGIACYLDDDDNENSDRDRGFVTCLDSLPRLVFGRGKDSARIVYGTLKPTYDVIIIDESEQVVQHLFGETIKQRGNLSQINHALKKVLGQAKAVYALDADLSYLTYRMLETYRPADFDSGVRVIQNTWIDRDAKHEILMYQSRDDLLRELKKVVKEGKKCLVACNSKKDVEIIGDVIKAGCQEPLQSLSITSDNSSEPDVVRFLSNIAAGFRDIQVLIASPSLGTGVDISFPGGECVIDHVFGFFHSNVNTHFDIDQQLARVRNPGAVSVWISHSGKKASVDFEEVKREVLEKKKLHWVIDEHKGDGTHVPGSQYHLLDLATHVECHQRTSKNHLRTLFEKSRRADGWDIQVVSKAPKASQSKTTDPTLFAQATKNSKERKVQDVLDADVIDGDGYLDLEIQRAREKLTRAEKASVIRYKVMMAAGYIDKDIVRRWIEDELEGKIKEFSELRNHIDQLDTENDWKPEEIYTSNNFKANTPRWMVCWRVMSECGISSIDSSGSNWSFRSSQVVGFIKFCQDHRDRIEAIMGFKIRNDIDKNPIRQLNAFLDVVGLKAVEMKRSSRGSSIRTYGLEEKTITSMNNLADIHGEDNINGNGIQMGNYRYFKSSIGNSVGFESIN